MAINLFLCKYIFSVNYIILDQCAMSRCRAVQHVIKALYVKVRKKFSRKFLIQFWSKCTKSITQPYMWRKRDVFYATQLNLDKWESPKGHEISKGIYEVVALPKIWTKQSEKKSQFRFFQMRRLHLFILKLPDLYCVIS